MTIELKPLHIDDANQWLEIQRETYEPCREEYGDCESHPLADTVDMIVARLMKPCCHHYFVYSGDTIVGGIRIVWQNDKYEIGDLFVLPRFQNSGFGKSIVKMVEALYPSASSWELWTELQALRNHHFYETLGYSKTDSILKLNDKLSLVLFKKEMLH